MFHASAPSINQPGKSTWLGDNRLFFLLLALHSPSIPNGKFVCFIVKLGPPSHRADCAEYYENSNDLDRPEDADRGIVSPVDRVSRKAVTGFKDINKTRDNVGYAGENRAEKHRRCDVRMASIKWVII